MRKVLIQADDDLLERAKERAAQRGVSFARFAREALEKEVGPPQERRSRLIGAFESWSRVRELCHEHAGERIGYVDAAVLAVTERLGEPKLATLDHRPFTIMRPRHVQELELLPLRAM